MPENKGVSTSSAPSAIGPYSQGVVACAGTTVYVAGQAGVAPDTMKLVEGGLEAEAHQTLKNIGAILEASGLSFSDVVKCTV